MQDVSSSNFGPLIAYLVPGATSLWGLSQFIPAVHAWFAATPADTPTISGFLYLTLASVTMGMTVTAIRWALVDSLHRLTGLVPPNLDFSQLGGQVEAFNLLIEIHYRHYQFYANMFVATAIAYFCFQVHTGSRLQPGWPDALFIALEVVFFATSRDTLSKYYARTAQLLRRPAPPSSVGSGQ